MDVFSSSDKLAVLLHIQFAGFLGLGRPMEDGLGAPRSAKGPMDITLAQHTWMMDLECCGARNWTLRAAYRARSDMLDGCGVNLGTTLDRLMQSLVDNDEASIRRLGILSDIDENIP